MSGLPALVRLPDGLAAEEFAIAREMAQRIDVGAAVAAHSHGVGARAVAFGTNHVAVFAREAIEERRMRGEVGHAHEIGLGQVVNRGAG